METLATVCPSSLIASTRLPRRVLFATTYTGLGGGETLQLNLYCAFDRRRYLPSLVTPGQGAFPEKAAAAGVSTAQMPYRGAATAFVPALWARMPVAHRLARHIRETGTDIVVSDYHSLPYFVPAARKAGVPVVWLAIGWWFPVHRWQRRFFSRDVARIIAVSTAVKTRWLGCPPAVEPSHVEVIVPGVDVGHWRREAVASEAAALRAQLGAGAEAPLVVMVARFQDVKGHDTFLDMARLVLEAQPGVRFAVAGEEVFGVSRDHAYRQRILQRVSHDARLRDGVSYLGFLPDPRALMASA